MSTNQKAGWLHDPRTFAILKGAGVTTGMVIVAIALGIGLDRLLHTTPLMITMLLVLCIPGSMAATLSIARAAEKKIKAERQNV